MRDITFLRESLFDTMELLKQGKIDVATASAVAKLGTTIVDSARVEADYVLKSGTANVPSFLEQSSVASPSLPHTPDNRVHRLKG